MSANHIHRYQDSAPEDCKYNEHIPNHPLKSKKYNSIEANLREKLLLLDIFNGMEPAEWFTVKPQRCMFSVGASRSRCVDDGIAWSKPAKN